MSIVRDEYDERQTRIDAMIAEFRKAQARRRTRAATVKGDDQGVELQRAAEAVVAVAAATATPGSSH